jgi:hypothetical protein
MTKTAEVFVSSSKSLSETDSYITGTQSKRPISKTVWRWIRYFLIVFVVAAAFMGPVIKYSSSNYFGNVDDQVSREYQNLLFYSFLWLLVAWLGAVFVDLCAISLPYVFRLVIR